MQQAMLLTFYQLNKEVYRLHDILRFAPSSECETSFEFGVAEGVVFNYLDKEEVNRLQKSVAKKAMSIIDFLCVVRYHRVNKEKRVPLRFDYHLLRFMFNKNNYVSVHTNHYHESVSRKHMNIERVSLHFKK